MNFDITGYLEDRGIPYDVTGDNVGKGWVGIHCPFPQCSDHLRHLGIKKANMTFSCWICGTKGHIEKLIMELEGCSYGKARSIMSQYPAFFDDEQDESKANEQKTLQRHLGTQIMPKEATKEFRNMHLNWLRGRNFNPDRLIPKFNLYSVYNEGRWRGRIVAPIYLERRLVSFITRDVTGNASLPYIDCPEAECIIAPKKTLYNIDTVKPGGSAILVEGITDVWRLGDKAIASFTSNMTGEQKKLLLTKKLNKLFVLYDEDAYNKAKRLAEELSSFMKIEVVKLDEGDPAELTNDQARELKYDLIGEY